MIKLKILLSALILTCFFRLSFSQNETIVLMKTNMGDMKIKLYNQTPQHRDNFVNLVNKNFYNGLLFHRVIKDFMIQAGDPASKNATKDKQLGSGGPGYTIPAEIQTGLIHKKGALSAARQGDQVNPSKASSGSQFYIVQGKTYTDEGLNQVEQNIKQSVLVGRMRTYMMLPENKNLRNEVEQYQRTKNKPKLDSVQQLVNEKVKQMHPDEVDFKYTPEQREIYKTIGGTPFLDMSYTVFGEVIEGLDVVDKIAVVPTLQGDRPENDVVIISMKIVK